MNPSAISIERTNLGGGVDDADGETPVRVKMDATSQSLRVNLWVWDTGTLSWVKMQQPSLDTDLANIESLEAGTYWKDQRYDYTSGNLDYKGQNTTHKEATNAETWYIQKYTWMGDNVVRIEGPLVGAWDDRASLAWAS